MMDGSIAQRRSEQEAVWVAMADQMMPTAEDLTVFSLFCERAVERRSQIIKSNGRFVHYTSAENALNIIRNATVWMRKTSLMNDFSEIRFGMDLLMRALLNTNEGKSLQKCLSSFSDMQSLRDFESVFASLEHETYVVSISEHDDDEDFFGRLSMWRAYCGASGVALILNHGPFTRPSDALASYTSPVCYFSLEDAIQEIGSTAGRLNANSEFLRTVPKEKIDANIKAYLANFVLTTKHKGFREEREWRVINTPLFGKSENLGEEIACVRGVPQIIKKLYLKDIPAQGLTGMMPDTLLNRVIIGPCAHSYPTYQALYRALGEAGVRNPSERMYISDIPLRSSL